MFYSIVNGESQTDEELVLELASIEREEAEELLSKAGFLKIKQYGDYDFSDYDPDLSPRLIVLAEKGV